MTPSDLTPAVFAAWPPAARAFALRSLPLLQQLPLAVCPSFLQQMRALDTSFPVEIATLANLCDGLRTLPSARLEAVLAPLRLLRLSPELTAMDWPAHPETFLAAFSAWLWSSAQIDAFRNASAALFATVPPLPDTTDRLTIVVLGRGSTLQLPHPFARLRRHGLLLTALAQATAPAEIYSSFSTHAAGSPEPYAHWYVDGGSPWTDGYARLPTTVAVDYPSLDSLRTRVLAGMESAVNHGNAGAELLRSNMARTTQDDLRAAELTPDPVLQRFYTELFTLSSGPQIFSTSFVQWTGRELFRRARPHTVLLRYAPRQQNRSFNTLLQAGAAASLDPDGSLLDAEMGAYYTWIEAQRVTRSGRNTFLAWREGTATALLIGRNTAPGTVFTTPLTVSEALARFS